MKRDHGVSSGNTINGGVKGGVKVVVLYGFLL